MFLATYDSGSYRWTALGSTEHEARDLIVAAYAKHVATCDPMWPADPQLMRDAAENGDINILPIAVGNAFRDDRLMIGE